MTRTAVFTQVAHIWDWIEDHVDLTTASVAMGVHDYPEFPDLNVHVQFIADSLSALESLADRIPWSHDGDRFGQNFVPTWRDGMWHRAGTAFGAEVTITCGECVAVAS